MEDKETPLSTVAADASRPRPAWAARNVTMQQIADICRVSKVTVGRAFQHPEKVRPKTRQLILDTARELGYTYNALAATLGQSRKPFVGLIAASGNDSQLKSILRETQSMIREDGLDLLLGITELDPQQEATLINRYIQYQALGIVIYGVTLETLESRSSLLLNPSCPVLLIGGPFQNPDLNSIGTDTYKASYAMTEYLIRFGHADIALICGRYDVSSRAEARFRGYRDALQRYGVPLHEDYVVITYSDSDASENDIITTGYQAMERLASLPRRPTVVMFPSDMFALGGMLQAQKQGLRIPQDISVVSMYEYSLSSWLEPGLTTIRVPEKEIARGTIAFFRDILAGRPPFGWRTVLPTELVIRGSCASPRKA